MKPKVLLNFLMYTAVPETILDLFHVPI